MILASADPGKSSGLAVLDVQPTRVELVGAFQVSGGVGGFRALVSKVQAEWPDAQWIAEKFSPRPGQGFTHGLDSTLPLVCEGVLIDRDLLPEYAPGLKVWRSPQLQYLVGGDTLARKKSRTHRFLKDSGFYRTGKMLDSADADDFRSACAHGLAYIAREVGHRPTFNMIADWTERNPV